MEEQHSLGTQWHKAIFILTGHSKKPWDFNIASSCASWSQMFFPSFRGHLVRPRSQSTLAIAIPMSGLFLCSVQKATQTGCIYWWKITFSCQNASVVYCYDHMPCSPRSFVVALPSWILCHNCHPCLVFDGINQSEAWNVNAKFGDNDTFFVPQRTFCFRFALKTKLNPCEADCILKTCISYVEEDQDSQRCGEGESATESWHCVWLASK